MLNALLMQARDTAVIMGIIALVGLLLQKKSAVDVISGTVKTIIGVTVMSVFVVAVNRLFWNPLQRMAERRFTLN